MDTGLAALFSLISLGISSPVPMFRSVSFFNRSIFRESNFQMSQGIRLEDKLPSSRYRAPSIYIYVADTRIHRCYVAKFEPLHQNSYVTNISVGSMSSSAPMHLLFYLNNIKRLK